MFAEWPLPASLRNRFSHAALGPAHETVIGGCVRPVFGWTVAPSAAALENLNDATDHAAIVHPINSTHVRGQMRFDACPLLIVQPKRLLRMIQSSSKTNKDRMESGLSCFNSTINEFWP